MASNQGKLPATKPGSGNNAWSRFVKLGLAVIALGSGPQETLLAETG